MKEDCKTCAKDKCPMHPNYKAKYKPRCNCKECWEIWEKRQKGFRGIEEDNKAQRKEDLDNYSTPEYH